MDISEHPKFKYIAGMTAVDGPRVLSTWIDDGEQFLSFANDRSSGPFAGPDIRLCSARQFRELYPVLDVEDAATRGCLESLHLQALKLSEDGRGANAAAALMKTWGK